MIRKIKPIAKKCLIGAGLLNVTKIFTSSVPRLFMYHRFGDNPNEKSKTLSNIFEHQLALISGSYDIISLTELYKNIQEGKKINNKVIITIDDGYQDFYEIAYPILKKYSAPAIIYITTDFIDGKIWLWPDLVEYILNMTNSVNLNLEYSTGKINLELTTDNCKKTAWKTLIKILINERDEIKWKIIYQISKKLDIKIPDSPIEKYKPLTWQQIKEISENNIEIGSHTCTHPIISRLDEDKLHYEISESKKIIEERTGNQVNHFCFPNGMNQDFTDRSIELLKLNNYKTATVAFHDKDVYNNLYSIKRYPASNNIENFREKLYGLEYCMDIIRS